MYVRKEERAQINELVFHVKKLKREEQIKAQISSSKENDNNKYRNQ